MNSSYIHIGASKVEEYWETLENSPEIPLTLEDLTELRNAVSDNGNTTNADCDHFYSVNPDTQESQCVKCGKFQ